VIFQFEDDCDANVPHPSAMEMVQMWLNARFGDE